MKRWIAFLLVIPMFYLDLTAAIASTANSRNHQQSAAHAAPAFHRDDQWVLRLPKEADVKFQGEVSFDNAGGKGGAMMYPAVDPISFLAAILVHGAIVDATKKHEKTKMQLAADKVLDPYAALINTYTNREFFSSSLNRLAFGNAESLVDHDAKPAAQWIIDVAPIFTMAQSEDALWLEVGFVVRHNDAPTTVVHQVVVRVLSSAVVETDRQEYWRRDAGEQLKNTSLDLLSQSLELLFNELSGATVAADTPYRTVRYLEGRRERMERAQVSEYRCNRIVLKTLRGWIMSAPWVPTSDVSQDQLHCPDHGSAVASHQSINSSSGGESAAESPSKLQ